IVKCVGEERGGAQAVIVKTTLHPCKEGLHMGLAVCQAMQLLGFTRNSQPSNIFFDRVERTDSSECLEYTLRLCALGINKLATRVTPAQGTGDTDFLRVACIGSVATSQNNRARCMFNSQEPVHAFGLPGWEERETHLVVSTIDWPEVAHFHLP